MGEKKHLLAVVGNNSSKSYNRKLLYAMNELFGNDVDFVIQEIKGLPLFSEDLLDDVPADIATIAQRIEQADGVVLATCEYDHAVPAALKSFIEWMSSAYHPFTDKPVMIVGASLGIQGTVRAQMNLRQILDSPGVNAIVVPGNEFMLPRAAAAFTEDGQLKDEHSVAFLKQCFNNFMAYIDINNSSRLAQG